LKDNKSNDESFVNEESAESLCEDQLNEKEEYVEDLSDSSSSDRKHKKTLKNIKLSKYSNSQLVIDKERRKDLFSHL
jgi:hypothetical protein